MTRPAKKPTRGGKRPGAGRPATGRTVRPVQLHLPPEALAALDAHRGALTRSRWAAEVILAAAAALEAIAPAAGPPAPAGCEGCGDPHPPCLIKRGRVLWLCPACEAAAPAITT